VSGARAWLEPHLADAPPQLRERMLSALQPSESVAQSLADGAMTCLRAAINRPEDALDLLAADALLTHACAAAAEQGDAALERFTALLDATRFQQLLGSAG
jgi:hypothetical protein